MNNNYIFIEKYKELEHVTRKIYNIPENRSPIKYLEAISDSKRKNKLRYCREIRNFLQHENKLKEEFLVVASDAMIELITDLIEYVENPPRCKQYMIGLQQVFSGSLDDLVLPAITKMKECNYTHLPILYDGVVFGVFSENTLFSKILEDEIIMIDKTTQFHDLAAHLPVDKHATEVFRFLPQNALISEAEKLFQEALPKMQRIGMIFLTQNGIPTEKILGILTPWDILGMSFDARI